MTRTLSPELFRMAVSDCLGEGWPDPPALKPILGEVRQMEGYRLESVSYLSEPGDRIPAYVLIPDGVDANSPVPAIAVWHQHNGQFNLGKSEPAGLAGDPSQHAGVALAREGYVVICPDALCFEERQDDKLEDGAYERFAFLKYVVEGSSLAWKNILDMFAAVDYLCTRPEVDSDRLGCYGHSLGSTFTWLVGPWEPRLKCLVGNCCLPTYAAIHRRHLLHSFSNFIPRLLLFGDIPDVAALIAPRALHLNFGSEDALSPIEEVREAMVTIGDTYAELGAEANFSYFIEEGIGHACTPSMWEQTLRTFRKNLPL